ncbi:AAA family ATPase [Candidatus Nitrosotenuis cloacae]|uniref:Uncharacterized protein n=1 Tax=Candidatus Nitrosotenuis cloacae TaxID=1603555 RepID=A0A3G1B0R3_9ARCH|nr:AAA family ATPase [Candidatus Nitrosotenuis cloacae]AJZ75174.1 hypothetical protein SU86_000865 [Candidatus Nitrosotenuis cloacae]
MVYINSLKFDNLYSYSNGNTIELAKNNVIAGPNNSGKSNIFRIVKLLVNTLANKKDLNESEMFPKTSSASLESDMILSRSESRLLVEFLSFHLEPPNNMSRFYEFKNFENLIELFRYLVIRLSWRKSLDRSGFEPFVELEFKKLGLVFFSRFVSSYFLISNKSTEKDGYPDIKEPPLHEVLERLAESNNPISETNRFCDSNPNGFLKVENYRRDSNYNMPDNGRTIIQNIMTFLDIDAHSNTDFSFADVLGKILANGIRQSGSGIRLNQIMMSEMAKEIQFERSYNQGGEASQTNWFNDTLESRAQKKDIGFTDNLKEDGSNMAQFLFSLRNSPKLSDRERYSTIKDAFDELCRSDDLEFDVILDYIIEKRPRVSKVDLKSEPKFPKIIIVNKTSKLHYSIDQVGSGISEILYLVTTAFGTENSVILMDEPTLNLHPPKMRALISKIQENETNQFIIITHSPELTHYLIFEKSANIIYVKRANEQSKISIINKEEFDQQRSRLKHQIDTRIFFAKCVILTEGESDKNLFGIAEYLQTIEPDLNLANNDVLVVNVGGNSNFAKYQKLLDAFTIPYIVFSDRNSLGLLKHLDHCFMTKESIGGDQKIILIDYGNLEDLLKEINGDLYNALEREYGNSKPTVAFEFAKQISEKNPDALKSIKSLITRAIMMSQK